MLILQAFKGIYISPNVINVSIPLLIPDERRRRPKLRLPDIKHSLKIETFDTLVDGECFHRCFNHEPPLPQYPSFTGLRPQIRRGQNPQEHRSNVLTARMRQPTVHR